jgi:hypothetical protein
VDKMIEVRYAGVVVGRSAVIRELDTRGLFLGVTDPLPVGTDVTLKVDDRVVEGKVASVQESQEIARAGMRVRFADPTAASLFGTPVEAGPEPEIPPPVAAAASVAVSASPVEAHSPGSGAHRRIVVDASTEKAAAPADAHAGDDRGDAGDGAVEGAADGSGAYDVSGAVDGDSRIPAPDPSALGGHPAGGRKGRRGRRR